MFESKSVLMCESNPAIVEDAHFAGPCRGSIFRFINKIHPQWLPMTRCEQHAPVAKYGWIKA